MSVVHSVLLLCTGNSCRSQMAEAYFRKFTNGKWRCESAGTKPTGYVHSFAITAMREDGVDISAQRSKSLAAFTVEDWGYVITVCDAAAETCPVLAGADVVLHWPFPDPADVSGSREEQLIAFRKTRDAIKVCVGEFLRDLDGN